MQKKDKINVDNAKYDSCGVRIIAASDMPVSLWSGGRTTEIYIAPEGALYAERNFLFRISTAEVELEESDFTSLPDYNRLIASVSGTMRLAHGANGSEKLVLPRSTRVCIRRRNSNPLRRQSAGFEPYASQRCGGRRAGVC